MKTGKKLFTGTLLALCAALLVLCIVLAAGWSKAAKTNTALPEVRNNGTAIQWKYSDETDWRDLVLLTELTGAAGENGKNGTDGKDGSNGADGKNGIDGTNGKDGADGINGKDGADGINGKDGANGKDGINGANGKDGINGKSIEVQRATEYIQWRYEGDEWQNLVAIADITGPAGQNGADGANGKTPEFRVNENTLQWRYTGDEIWLNLYDLSVLKGLDGKDGINGKDGIDGKDGAAGKDGTNGQNGSDGEDGKTPFIGENGNWWIGEIDTGVKAVGTDGIDGTNGVDGEKGDKGDKGDIGDKGDKGDKGDPGQNGGCSGYFHAKASIGTALLQNHAARFEFTTKINKGGLISASANEITLKKGHIYNITISGSLGVSSNASDNSGFYGIQMTDSSEDADFCRNITRIKRDGTKLPYSNDYHFFNFNRMYDASARDITLKFLFEQSEYNTLLEGFSGTITITALD